jgi:hypothetical protein
MFIYVAISLSHFILLTYDGLPYPVLAGLVLLLILLAVARAEDLV